MDIYCDKNLEWVPTQVRYFPFLSIMAMQTPTTRQAALRVKSCWYLEDSSIAGFSYGRIKEGSNGKFVGNLRPKLGHSSVS